MKLLEKIIQQGEQLRIRNKEKADKTAFEISRKTEEFFLDMLKDAEVTYDPGEFSADGYAIKFLDTHAYLVREMYPVSKRLPGWYWAVDCPDCHQRLKDNAFGNELEEIGKNLLIFLVPPHVCLKDQQVAGWSWEVELE